MGRRRVGLVFGVWVFLFFVAVFGVVLNVPLVRGSGTIYIRADGSVEGTDKIHRDGNVYTFTGNIDYSIVVERDNIVVDGAGYTVQGTGSGIGIDLSYRNNVTLKNVEVINFRNGIYLDYSSNNTLAGNTASNNYLDGICLDYSSNNTLAGNTASNNYYGIALAYSSNNVFFHNNFINNTVQVTHVTAEYTNIWDDGYPSGGNYWSDYAGRDLNVDGIGDIPYIIDENNQDRYPLMSPYGEVPEDLPPMTIHDYDGLWHTTDFTITLTATDGVAQTYYKINNGPTKTVSVDGQPLITIEGADNKLEYWSVDNAGNKESHHILTGIKLDKTAPTGSIVINNGDAYTTSTSVTLTLTATDATSGIYQVRFSNDGTWDTEPWETPSPTKTWTLTSGDGTKTVYYQIKDNAGLISPSYQDAIILDTTKPTANAGIDQTVTVGATVTFDGGGSTDNVGIVSYEWDFGDGTTGTGKTTTHIYANTGTYTVTLTVKDAAGNSATQTVTVTVISPPPAEAFPMWIIGAATAIVAIAVATTILRKRRK